MTACPSDTGPTMRLEIHAGFYLVAGWTLRQSGGFLALLMLTFKNHICRGETHQALPFGNALIYLWFDLFVK